MSEKIPDYMRPLTDEEEARYQAWLTKRREEIKADYEAEYGKDEDCVHCGRLLDEDGNPTCDCPQ